MSRTNLISALVIAGIVLSAAPAAAAPRAPAPSEAELKAACVMNLVRFVEWPFAEVATTLLVVEPNPFGEALVTAAADATLPLRLEVKTVAATGPAPPCRIVFAGKASGAAGVAAAVGADLGTLTVGETEEFLARGGIVRLLVVKGRVRLEINVDAAERSGLRISSSLMKLATLRHERELR